MAFFEEGELMDTKWKEFGDKLYEAMKRPDISMTWEQLTGANVIPFRGKMRVLEWWEQEPSLSAMKHVLEDIGWRVSPMPDRTFLCSHPEIEKADYTPFDLIGAYMAQCDHYNEAIVMEVIIDLREALDRARRVMA